jgi:Domain of unknown function (DUF4337)
MTTEHDTSNNRSDRFEIAMATLLGIATVLIAFSALRSALLGDTVLSGFTTSTQAYNDALGLASEDTQAFVQDQNLFLRYAEAKQKGDTAFANYMRNSLFEPELEQAIAWWETNEARTDGPSSPFDTGTPYASRYQAKIDQLNANGDAEFEKAKKADDQGDNFDIATAVLAITLFAGGVASLLKSRRARLMLACVGVAGLAMGLTFMAKGQMG